MFLVRGLVRQDFFSRPTGNSEWFPRVFSVKPGIPCPGVNKEKLPAKCLPFPVMVWWCLADSFAWSPQQTFLESDKGNFPGIAGIFS
jgi:hypothetical protein